MIDDLERATLPFPPDALFDLIADVERFPQFVPLVRAVRITARRSDGVDVDMVLGEGPVSRRIKSRARFDRPHRIDIEAWDAWLERCQQSWTFEPADGGTEVSFACQIVPKGPLARLLLSANLRQHAGIMLAAFERRAHHCLAPSLQVTGDRP